MFAEQPLALPGLLNTHATAYTFWGCETFFCLKFNYHFFLLPQVKKTFDIISKKELLTNPV